MDHHLYCITGSIGLVSSILYFLSNRNKKQYESLKSRVPTIQPDTNIEKLYTQYAHDPLFEKTDKISKLAFVEVIGHISEIRKNAFIVNDNVFVHISYQPSASTQQGDSVTMLGELMKVDGLEGYMLSWPVTSYAEQFGLPLMVSSGNVQLKMDLFDKRIRFWGMMKKSAFWVCVGVILLGGYWFVKSLLREKRKEEKQTLWRTALKWLGIAGIAVAGVTVFCHFKNT